jgi:uncharacterized oxidoreductase
LAYHINMILTGNTILITGGTSGIGLGFAKKFAELGNNIIICGRRKDRLKKISEINANVTGIQCDLSITNNREDLVKKVLKDYPSVNVLVNNAGIQLANDLTKPIDVSKIRQEIEINFVAPVHLSSLLVNQLKQQTNSTIINISSGLGYAPIAFMPVYCATKAAIHSWSLSLRKQLENTSIKVFEIAPPSVDTELGYQNRQDKAQSHGGMPVEDFIGEAFKALADDKFQAGVGPAANLMKLRDTIFDQLNSNR